MAPATKMTAAAKMASASESNSGKIAGALEILRSDLPSNIYFPLPLQSVIIRTRPTSIDPLLPLSLFSTLVDIPLPVCVYAIAA
jgi:hypothetical protein